MSDQQDPAASLQESEEQAASLPNEMPSSECGGWVLRDETFDAGAR